MTETIQKFLHTEAQIRRDFIAEAATLYGVSLSSAELHELDELSDIGALTRAFPWQSDAERNEALWALGQALNADVGSDR